MGDKETAIENLEKAQGKQTGPKTESGKDASRRNALRHGGYAESVVFPNCKEDKCKIHQIGVCNYFRDNVVDKSKQCLREMENFRARKKEFMEDGKAAAKEGISTLAALQENTVIKAHGVIQEDGIMTAEVIGVDKEGNPITKRALHGALDYTRRATKDTNEILKDLTGFDKEKSSGGGFAVSDVIRALEEEDANAE